MSKPRITAAAVLAAHEVLERYEVPDNYFRVSADEQRRMQMSVVRQALIAAHLADNPSPQPRSLPTAPSKEGSTDE